MIIIFGPAGSGKSTQGQNLAEYYGWKWLSVGQVLRNAGEFDEVLRQGDLVDDDVVIELMRREMERAEADGENMIVDGYPRNRYQAEWVAKNMIKEIEGMIILKVPKEELLKRLGERGREDDVSAEVIEKRLGIYEANIGQILPLLTEKGAKMVEVSGVGSVEEVSGRLKKTIEELVPGATEQVQDVNGDEIERSYGE